MIDGLVRVSFQSVPAANNDARIALTGALTVKAQTGPFYRVNTQVFECDDADPQDVIDALNRLNVVLTNHSASIDFLSVSLTKHRYSRGKV